MSTVQMEYICHKKPDKVLEMIDELVLCAKKYCNDVDFVAAEKELIKNIKEMKAAHLD